MFIRQLRLYSPHLLRTTPGRPGVMLQSIVCVSSRRSINAMPTNLRCDIGNQQEKNHARKNQKVLLSLRAVRGRGIAVFESFSELIGLLLGSGQ